MDEASRWSTRVVPVVAIVSGTVATTAVLLQPDFGGLIAGIHLVAVAGWPVVEALRHVVPSPSIRLGLTVAMSLAVSVLSFQVLFWFGFAEPVAVIGLATLYGLALSWLLPRVLGTGGWGAEGVQ